LRGSVLLGLALGSAACEGPGTAAGRSAPVRSPEPVEEASAGPEEPDIAGESEEGAEGLEVALGPVASENAPQGAGLLAREALRQLSQVKRSTYTHRTHVDEAEGVFDYDCSGFVDYALARVAPDALGDVRRATVDRPLAKHFVSFIAALPPSGSGRWRRILRAAELEPGDLVAWLRPPDVASRNTGHVMIVRGASSPSSDLPGGVVVPIFDSTSVRHGKEDSRSRSRATGLGTGTILLVVGADGVAVGYQWSRGRRALPHTTTVVVGRLD
jgi:hypothetical protein